VSTYSWHTEFDSIVERLNSNVLYRLSLTSKELFHSNFLSWLFDSYPELISEILPTEVELGLHGQPSRRELEHLDLVVYPSNSKTIVLENKVFSPVSLEQLKKYDEKVLPQLHFLERPSQPVSSCTRVLLTLLEAEGSITGCDNWRHIRYDQIHAAFESFAQHHSLEPFDESLIRHYIDLLAALIDLRDGVGCVRNGEALELNFEAPDYEVDTRVRDFVGKARFTSALRAIQTNNFRDFLNKKINDRISFTNGKPLIESFVEVEDGCQLGWQYQNGQIRIALKVGGKGLSRREREEIAESQFGDYFDELIWSKQVSLSPSEFSYKNPPATKSEQWKFHSYEPNFVYRYVPVENITMEQLFDVDKAMVKMIMHHGIPAINDNP